MTKFVNTYFTLSLLINNHHSLLYQTAVFGKMEERNNSVGEGLYQINSRMRRKVAQSGRESWLVACLPRANHTMSFDPQATPEGPPRKDIYPSF